MKNKSAGKFIVLDGPDGCGKSTQAALLAKWLKEQGAAVEVFRDPGTTAIGEKIRQILLNPEHVAMDVRTELLLYMASRAQLWEEKIAPALGEGKWVIADRWLSSSCAYQGYAGGFGIENVLKTAEHSLARVWPDLTIILDVDLETGTKRLKGQPDRMEQKGGEYHEKVRQGFAKLGLRKNCIVIDASATIEKVQQKIVSAIQESFQLRPCQ